MSLEPPTPAAAAAPQELPARSRAGATGDGSAPPYESPPLLVPREGQGPGWLVPLVALLVLAAIWAWRALAPAGPALTLVAGDAAEGAGEETAGVAAVAGGQAAGEEGAGGQPGGQGELALGRAEEGAATGDAAGRLQAGETAGEGPAVRGEEMPAALVVHVAGAVMSPGVYSLPAGARVIDAIEAAGGPRPQAELHALNLAAPLEDGIRIEVPTKEEVASGRFAPPVTGSGPVKAGSPESPTPARVDINRASAAELEQLPGIGPALAERIVADREVNGPFRRPEDLTRVAGIGEKTLARLLPYIRAGR
ncbi:MAG TPA: ComEA family DNA-binding protein [Thermaerobacter sp.]